MKKSYLSSINGGSEEPLEFYYFFTQEQKHSIVSLVGRIEDAGLPLSPGP